MLTRVIFAAALLASSALAQTPPPAAVAPAPMAPAPLPAPTAPPPGATGVNPADQSACSNAATQATGFVPGQTAVPTMTNPNAGSRVGGAAVGAATGASVGAIQGNNAGTAAASGAAAGAIIGGSQVRRGRRQASAANKQAEQQMAAKQTAWNNSYVACMSQRGYVAQAAPAS